MEPKESKTSKHFKISMVKSSFRIIAGTALMLQFIGMAGFFFLVAEILGILEEL